MPRSNRPRSRRGGDTPADAPLDLDRITAGLRRSVTKRSGAWHVQNVSAASAQKVYVCPGCQLDIPRGQAHLVAWRADGPLNDETALAARRHWHTYCWRMEP